MILLEGTNAIMPAYKSRETELSFHEGRYDPALRSYRTVPASAIANISNDNPEEWKNSFFFLIGEEFPEDIKEKDLLPDNNYYWDGDEFVSLSNKPSLYVRLGDAEHTIWQITVREKIDVSFRIIRAQKSNKGNLRFLAWESSN